MEIPASPVAPTSDTCLVRDHYLPSQYYCNPVNRNIKIYAPYFEHKGKSFFEVYGDFYDTQASVNFLCHAIMAKTETPESRAKFETLIFKPLFAMASEVTGYSPVPSAKALGSYTDATYTGPNAYHCSIPLTHCVWFSAEYKYRKSGSIELKDATVQHLLGTLKPRIERAIAVVTAACRNNKMYCILDHEVLLTLNAVLRAVNDLITA